MSSLREPERGSFEHLLKPARVRISSLVRMSASAATEPYFGKRSSHRFDDPSLPSHARFGVLYAGMTTAIAFCESVLHENSFFANGAHELPAADMARRTKVYFVHPTRQQLRLADLTGRNLKVLGLNVDLVAGNAYGLSQRWSKAIHDCDTRWDGIRYPSRQNPEGAACAIFDRVGLLKDRHEPMDAEEQRALCDAFNVRLV